MIFTHKHEGNNLFMDLLTLKGEFLLKNKHYRGDVKNFLVYMQNYSPWRVILPAQQEMLVSSVNTDTVIESLRYYIDIAQTITKQEPAKKYCSAVKAFFEYIFEKVPDNSSPFKNELAATYTRITTDFIENCDLLKEKEPMDSLDEESATNLIIWCDSTIAQICAKPYPLSETDFRKFGVSLSMKLMLLAGITYRVLRQLKLQQLDPQANTLKLSNYIIRLPLNLSRQFQSYHAYHNEYISSEHLFCDVHGNQWGEKTSNAGIPYYLSIASQSTSMTSVLKSGIIQLIKNGINERTIMRITGASSEIVDSCLDDLDRSPRWQQSIDSRIVLTDYYCIL